jgi:hypothetical protein
MCLDARPNDPPNRLSNSTRLHYGYLTTGVGAVATPVKALSPYGHTALSCQTGTGPGNGVYVGRFSAIDRIAVQPSTTYTALAWIKGISGYSGVNLVWLFRDQNLALLGSVVQPLTGDWVQYALTFTTPATATHIYGVAAKSSHPADVNFYLAGLMLVEGAVAPQHFNAGPASRYDEVTDVLLAAEWSRGYPAGATAGQMPQNGRAAISLRNDTRSYSPAYAAGPLAGLVEPGRRGRLAMVTGAGTVTLWEGWLAQIQPGVGQYLDPITRLEFEQGLNRLARTPAELPVQVNQRADSIIGSALQPTQAAPTLRHFWRLDYSRLDADAFLMEASDQLASESALSRPAYLGDDWGAATSASRVVAEALAGEAGLFWQTRGGSFVFKNRHYLPKKTANDGTVLVDDEAVGAALAYRQPTTHVRVRAYPREVSAGDELLWTLQKALRLGPGATRTVIAALSNDSGVSVGVLSLAAPVLTAVDGSGNPASDNVTVWQEARGGAVRVRLQNNAAYTVTVSGLQLYGQTLTRYDAATVEAVDIDSLVAYGRHEMALDISALDELADAEAYAHYRLHQVKQPQPVLAELTLRGRDDWLQRAADWEIGTRLALSERQMGGGTADYFVMGERGRLVDGLVEAAFALTAADAVRYWVLDTSALGVDTVVGY